MLNNLQTPPAEQHSVVENCVYSIKSDSTPEAEAPSLSTPGTPSTDRPAPGRETNGEDAHQNRQIFLPVTAAGWHPEPLVETSHAAGQLPSGAAAQEPSAAAGDAAQPCPSTIPAIAAALSPLALYDRARRALAEAKAVDEVKRIRDEAEAFRAYARQAKDRGLEQDAAELRWRAERRLGEIIQLQKQTVGLNAGGRPAKTGVQKTPVSPSRDHGSQAAERPQKLPTLAEAGIDKNLAKHARQLAALPVDEFEEIVLEGRNAFERIPADLMQVRHHRTTGTGENEWYTPAVYLDAARAVLGGFDLDPASSEIAQRSVRAAKFYTKEDNGLKQPWLGRVWLNPPYAKELIPLFISKLLAELQDGNVTRAILLTHAYTSSGWFQDAAHVASAISLPAERVKFIDPKGVKASPTQGQTFFYFGNEPLKFADTFSQFGLVFPRCIEGMAGQRDLCKAEGELSVGPIPPAGCNRPQPRVQVPYTATMSTDALGVV